MEEGSPHAHLQENHTSSHLGLVHLYEASALVNSFLPRSKWQWPEHQ